MASEKQKQDYLFLLVGRNPLPNYIAAHHLLKQNGRAILLHPPGGGGHTSRLAAILKRRLEAGPARTAEPRDLPTVGAREIANHVRAIVRDLKIRPEATVGLNYTGGTKPMAVHVYRTLEAELGRDVTFSYLNGQDLQLYIDGRGRFPANDRSLDLMLSDLAALHGYQTQEHKASRQTPQHLELAQAVLCVNQTRAGQWDWLRWRREGFTVGVLPTAADYPELEPFLQALDEHCPGSPTPEATAHLLGYQALDQCGKWFNGGWLEDIALQAVRDNVGKHQIGPAQYMGNLRLKPLPELELTTPRDFESDVLVMIGFQLFLISCIANSVRSKKGKAKDDRSETKKHLFEAYTRARQLGGDEARAAVVSLLEDPHSLEEEINREWLPPGGVRVFGRVHLSTLNARLRQWFAGRR
jgi:hypothetical protein